MCAIVLSSTRVADVGQWLRQLMSEQRDYGETYVRLMCENLDQILETNPVQSFEDLKAALKRWLRNEMENAEVSARELSLRIAEALETLNFQVTKDPWVEKSLLTGDFEIEVGCDRLEIKHPP